jgi:hypothetical protein
MPIMNCVYLELYTNNFAAKELKRNYARGVREQKRLNTNAIQNL